jgi:CRISPR-associated protein Csh1
LLESIKEWGEFAIKKNIISDDDILLSLGDLKNADYVLTVVLQTENNKLTYKRVDEEEYQSIKNSKYLYRRKAAQGVNFTPTAFVTEDVKKTFRNRILKWYEKNKDKNEHFKSVYAILKINQDKISDELKEKYSLLKESKRNLGGVLITMKFVEDSKERYIGDYDIYKSLLKESVLERYEHISSLGTSRGVGECFLCGTKGKVYGFVVPNILPFATLDKPGFCPQLSSENYWKYMPICNNCALMLETGKRFIEIYLDFSFKSINLSSLRYYVIPNILKSETRDDIWSTIQQYNNKEYDEGLITDEDYISDKAKNYNDIFTLSFIFYSEQLERQIVESFVEGIYPSRLREIYDAQKSIQEMNVFSEEYLKTIFGKSFTGSFFSKLKLEKKSNWYVFFLKDFCTYDKNTNRSEFVTLVSSILWKKKISNPYFYFMRRIRKYFFESDFTFREEVLKSFALLQFFIKTYIVEAKQMNSGAFIVSKDDLGFEEFFDSHNIYEPWKKAAFAVGVLIQYVLEIQRKEREIERGKEPFRSKLRGLMIDERNLKKLYTEAINKISEYGRINHKLEEIVSKYLVEAEGKINAPVDEISYYFTLGLALGNKFIYSGLREIVSNEQ